MERVLAVHDLKSFPPNQRACFEYGRAQIQKCVQLMRDQMVI